MTTDERHRDVLERPVIERASRLAAQLVNSYHILKALPLLISPTTLLAHHTDDHKVLMGGVDEAVRMGSQSGGVDGPLAWFAISFVAALVLIGILRWREVPRYVIIAVVLVAIAIPSGFTLLDVSRSGSGAGLYSNDWTPDPMQQYWDPENFYIPESVIEGRFSGKQCIQCHQGLTPGIVRDWRESKHSAPSNGDDIVMCPACHGDDHADLHLPTPAICGGCHTTQLAQLGEEKRYGFPSHALAMERAVDAKHFVDKPKPEVLSCLQCHSVATKCDSCHTRHSFSAAEARRSESCITCHSGPPHPDDKTYFASAHGKVYSEEGGDWDWSKPLKKGNYKAPTCAYCHMEEGVHSVAHKSIWKFGIREINPNTSGNKVLRERWVKLCMDCHQEEESRGWLKEMDQERKKAWDKLYAAEQILKDLRSEEKIDPPPGERPPYPHDTMDKLWPRAHIGFFEGQASAFYNVSEIERDYFEMWYFDNLHGYKAAAHGDTAGVEEAHRALEQDLAEIEKSAEKLYSTDSKDSVARQQDKELWNKGKYTDYNREHN